MFQIVLFYRIVLQIPYKYIFVFILYILFFIAANLLYIDIFFKYVFRDFHACISTVIYVLLLRMHALAGNFKGRHLCFTFLITIV